MSAGVLHRLDLDPLVAAAGRRRRPALVTSIVVGGSTRRCTRLQGQARRRRRSRGRTSSGTSRPTRAAYGLDGVRPSLQRRHDGRARASCATTPRPSRASGWSTPTWSRPPSSSSSRCKSYYAFPDSLDVDRYNDQRQVTTPSSRCASSTSSGCRPTSATGSTTTPSTPTASASSPPMATSATPTASRSSSSRTSRRPASSASSSRGSTSASSRPTYSIVGAPRAPRRASSTTRTAASAGQSNNTYAGRRAACRSSSFAGRLAYAIKYRELQLPALRRGQRRSQILYHRSRVTGSRRSRRG